MDGSTNFGQLLFDGISIGIQDLPSSEAQTTVAVSLSKPSSVLPTTIAFNVPLSVAYTSADRLFVGNSAGTAVNLSISFSHVASFSAKLKYFSPLISTIPAIPFIFLWLLPSLSEKLVIRLVTETPSELSTSSFVQVKPSLELYTSLFSASKYNLSTNRIMDVISAPTGSFPVVSLSHF